MADSKDTAESKAEQIERVEGMAEDRGDTWDLNRRDRAAIKAVLKDRARLLDLLRRMHERLIDGRQVPEWADGWAEEIEAAIGAADGGAK